MASHLDRQHLESSLMDDIAADACLHRMKPWPEPSRARHKAVEAEIRFSLAACALPSNRENKPETEFKENKSQIRQASKQASLGGLHQTYPHDTAGCDQYTGKR